MTIMAMHLIYIYCISRQNASTNSESLYRNIWE